MDKLIAQTSDNAHNLAAAGSLVLAQTGVEPWIPLIITIVNAIILLIRNKKTPPAGGAPAK